MPIINIGTSGSITYSVTNNTCFNSNNGSINISSIIFDDLYPAFTQYTVNWTSNNNTIDSNQIRDNGRFIILLYSGIYNFTIESLSTSSSLGPYSISIVDPDEFGLIKIKSSEYSCGENGNIIVEVSGGVPPYYFNIGSNSISQNSTEYMATGLNPGSYDIQITDSNGCAASNLTDYTSTIILQNSNFVINNLSILQPEILDGYGIFNVSISGYGPFSFSFTGPNNINYDTLDTTHLINHNTSNNIYDYSFRNSLIPGDYTVSVKNNYGCSLSLPIEIPNLIPMTVSTSIIPNNKGSAISAKSVFPIFDTIFIPFNNIQNNTALWSLIQKFIQQNKIDIKINNQIISQKISKNFLYPYCVDSNKIEIVRLDNDSNNWFFCFHVAPGIDLLNNLYLIDSEIFLVDKDADIEHKCLFGLNSDDQISHDYPSLLMGCLFLQGVATEEFYNGSNIFMKISDTLPTIENDYDFIIKNIKNNLYYNVYNNSYMTALYFLENFNVTTENIDINQTACSISNSDFQYIQNIKKMLLTINNFNNYQSLNIFNKDAVANLGSLSLFITGNPTASINDQILDNIFYIDYFTFDKDSDKLYSFYSNNERISNTTSLSNIPEGYVVIRIKDRNNNKIKFLNIDNTIINYDDHFLNVKNLLQNFNPKIKHLFEYGDILIYIPKNFESSSSINVINSVPTATTPVVSVEQQTGDIPVSTIQQSHDTTNTATISIITDPDRAVCYLIGPKNYKEKFIGYTVFDNVIPGVYNIVGDETYLEDNSLYQNNTRAIILKNQDYNISIKFNSYLDKVFIKE